MPIVVKYFSRTSFAHIGCCITSSTKRGVGVNGRPKPLCVLYSRLGETGESTVTISASKPLRWARWINWCDSSRCFQT